MTDSSVWTAHGATGKVYVVVKKGNKCLLFKSHQESVSCIPSNGDPDVIGAALHECLKGTQPNESTTDLSSEHKLNKSQQLKKVLRECGAVGDSFHVGISLVSLGIFYLAVSSGVDMTAVLFKLGFSESPLQSKRAAGTGTFLLAYAIHKLFAPLRLSITIVSVPFIVRCCWKMGFFKPPTPNL
uniref:DUF1279 domain-containing protein n=1 Tax=Anser cygnoides TaxID=8845 RepID=A0A8B9E781_ANSCY